MSTITTRQTGDAVTVLLAAHAINPFSRLFQRELSALLQKLEFRRRALSTVIISFAPEPNSVSNELAHLMALTPAQAADCMHMLGAYNGLLQRLRQLTVPVVAALHGAVSGHAFGLALACHHRVSLHDACFSFPQVQLGLSPVAGEIARSVRLAGLHAAAPLLLDGAVLNAQQARQAGLLHAVAYSQAELVRAATGVQDKHLQHPAPVLEPEPLPALLRARINHLTPVTRAILCAMIEGLPVNFAHALLIESRYFCQTAINPTAARSFSTEFNKSR